MNSIELRERFLSFFAANGHKVAASDGLIPSGDTTVLFTSAGMNQFKDYFLGKRADISCATSCQKCLRTGDLERVGQTPSHHTFFEMLGNFSFGDYFKEEAIQWAWEFLTGTLTYNGDKPSQYRDKLCLNLPAERLWVSIYDYDDEAFKLWRKLDIPQARIIRFGQAENFWPANAPLSGPNGPCGPCSEIYFDPDGKVQGPKSVEVWNLVFTQYDRQPDGSLKSLPKPNIDTGMGLERLASVVQSVETDYETDLFVPIVRALKALPRRKKLSQAQSLRAEWAISDHIRAIVFLLSEGLLPSNDSRGYVLRMLIRRAHRLGRIVLGVEPSGSLAFLSSLIGAVEDAFAGSPYSELLSRKRELMRQAIDREENQFIQTLDVGAAMLEGLMAKIKKDNKTLIAGEDAFRLYDTYGLPVELTVDIAKENGFSVDKAAFSKALSAQQERSRSASQFGSGIFVTDKLRVREAITDIVPKESHFVGYDLLESDAVIKGLWDGTRWVSEISQGQNAAIVLDHSPFYGEAGGQIGDIGRIEGLRGAAEVTNTIWADDVLMHEAKVLDGGLRLQEPARAVVDSERRLKVARSHTATHLLHWALRKVLGPDAVQAGSAVEAEKIRFDFSSLKALRDEQLHEVETLVNGRVRLADSVCAAKMQLEDAKRSGALALFGEKYGATVRVVSIGDYSKELCAGTHLSHTGFVGAFTVIGESSIASGTRRIEALVGEAAYEELHSHKRALQEAAARLNRPAKEIAQGLDELLEQIKHVQRQRSALQVELAKVQAQQLIAQAKKINGVTLVTSIIKQADREMLAALADALKASIEGEGVIVLASSEGSSQVSLVMATTLQISKRIHAGDILKAIAPLLNGTGGGSSKFAQGGGKNPSGIPLALKRAEELVRTLLEG